MPARTLVAGAAVLVMGGLSLSLALGGPAFSHADTTLGAAALLAAGWSLATAGVTFVVDGRHPSFGWLFVAAGAAWFLTEWDNPTSGSALVFTSGLVLFASGPPLAGWLALVHPTGRLATVMERVAVSAALVAGVVLLGLAPALFLDPATVGCSLCPDNLVVVSSRPGLASDLSGLGFRVAAATLVAVVAVAWWRLVRSSAARRRVAAPVVAVVSVHLGLVAWLYLVSAERGFIGTGDLERRLWFGQAATLVLLSLTVGWGRLRVRRTRSLLARVVVDLGAATRTGGLRQALADALGDPSLNVVYPVGDGRFADITGQLIELQTGPDVSATPIVRDGEPIASVLHRPGLLDDPDLVEEVATAARLALDNERLQARLRAHEADLRASRARVVAAADTERGRLERDLHDGAQQRLIGLLIALRLAASRAQAAGDETETARLRDAAGELQHAVDALRDIAHRIHPAVLTDEGLVGAFDVLAERSASPLTFAGFPNGRFPATVESAVYRLVADTARTGEVRVTADHHEGDLLVHVHARAVPDSLIELEDRIGAVDGRLTVVAHSDDGVRLDALIPCGEAPCA